MSFDVLAAADAAPPAGLGHLTRVSSVVQALRTRGIQSHCFGLGAVDELIVDGVEWEPVAGLDQVLGQARALLLDSYIPGSAAVRPDLPLACFYDAVGDPPGRAEVVIAPGLDQHAGAAWLSGLRFACLRPQYWGVKAAEVNDQVERILVTTGATDPDRVSELLVDAALTGSQPALVHRVRALGSHPVERERLRDLDPLPDLREQLRAADLVLCLGGQTALEAASLGVPTVAVPVAANQRPNIARLAGAGAVEEGRPEALVDQVRELAVDRERRRALARRARTAVDGFGALRVAAALDGMLAQHTG